MNITNKPLSLYDFMSRFTRDERARLRGNTKFDALLDDDLFMFGLMKKIPVSEMTRFVDYVISKQYIVPDRAKEILAA